MTNLTQKILRGIVHIKTRLVPIRRAQIGQYTIETTPNHPLTIYRARFPLYDMFIPAVCKSLNGTIVDIGANVGDTMAAILDSNPNLNVLCAEPDDQFFTILERNRIAIDGSDRVKTLKVFLSNSQENYKIVKNTTQSTGHIEKVEGNNATTRCLTFSQFLEEGNTIAPSLVKTDTDGFDAQILDSIAIHIQGHPECRPILFFEMQTYLQNKGFGDPGRRDRTNEYFRVIKRLAELGYCSFVAIDNFGTPLIRAHDFSILESIEQYVTCSQTLNNHTPVHFLDVVMYQEHHASIIDEALKRVSSIR